MRRDKVVTRLKKFWAWISSRLPSKMVSFSFYVRESEAPASHVFPWPCSLFHGHRQPRVLSPLGTGQKAVGDAQVAVGDVHATVPIQFSCLVFVAEMLPQNNTLHFPNFFHLRISKQFADIKQTLPAHPAAGDYSGRKEPGPREAVTWLEVRPQHRAALQRPSGGETPA